MPNGFLLTAEAVKKLRLDHATLKNRVRRLESMVSNIGLIGGREDHAFVKVTEEITPRVEATLGKGKADVQNIDIDYDTAGVLTDTGETITGYNIANVAIGVASYVMLKKHALAENWFIDFAEC